MLAPTVRPENLGDHRVSAFAGGFCNDIGQGVHDIGVVALIADESVVARSTVDYIVAGVAVNGVGKCVACARNIAGAYKGQVFDIGAKGITGQAGLDGVRAGGIDDSIGQGFDDEGVVAVAAVKGVDAGAARQSIVAVAAAEEIVTTAAGQNIVSHITDERVIALAAGDDVVAAAAVQVVVALRSGDDVVILVAGSNGQELANIDREAIGEA